MKYGSLQSRRSKSLTSRFFVTNNTATIYPDFRLRSYYSITPHYLARRLGVITRAEAKAVALGCN